MTEHAYRAGSCRSGLGGNSGAHVCAVYPVKGLIYQRRCGSSSSAKDYCGNRHALRIVELGGNAWTVFCGSCKSGVGVSKLFSACCELLAVYLSALPLGSVLGRILVKAFPPNSVCIIIESNICKNSVLLCGSQSVEVGFSICSGSNAEEAVFGVDSVKSAVLALLHPCDIVADCEYFIALSLVSLGRDKHCKVGLSAGRGESGCDVLNFAVRLFHAEDKHMLSHPALHFALIGSDTESEALLAEKNVSAVCGVDGPDGVVLGEVYDISVFRINLSFGMETSYKVVGLISKVLKSSLAHSCHDVHVKNNVDRICKLNAHFCEGRADRSHGVGDNVHCSALHNAVVERGQLSVHFLWIAPVVCRTRVLFASAAYESSVLNTCNVVGASSVVQAAGEFVLIKLIHFIPAVVGERAYLFRKSVKLFLRAVDPNDLFWLCERDHFVDPLVDIRVFCK